MTCPHCGAAWEPGDVRGVLYFQHSPDCRYEPLEIQTQAADEEREHDLWAWRTTGFTRRATPTERELLTHVGYTPDAGTPYTDNQRPGTLVRVQTIGSIRRRTFPNLPTAPGLPNPDAPWPPRTTPTPTPQPRQTWPGAW